MMERIGVVLLAAVWLTACGGEAESTDAAAADPAPRAAAPASPAAAPAPSAPPSRSSAAAAPAAASVPTAQDSAAAAREDVSPEWKMNERSMAPYAECMAQASTLPENVRARVEDACRTRPRAPR